MHWTGVMGIELTFQHRQVSSFYDPMGLGLKSSREAAQKFFISNAYVSEG
jgi:hypothetical protein